MSDTGRGMGDERGWTTRLPRAEAFRLDRRCTMCCEPWESCGGWAPLAPAGKGIFVLLVASLWRSASHPLGSGLVMPRCVRATVGYGKWPFWAMRLQEARGHSTGWRNFALKWSVRVRELELSNPMRSGRTHQARGQGGMPAECGANGRPFPPGLGKDTVAIATVRAEPLGGGLRLGTSSAGPPGVAGGPVTSKRRGFPASLRKVTPPLVIGRCGSTRGPRGRGDQCR